MGGTALPIPSAVTIDGLPDALWVIRISHCSHPTLVGENTRVKASSSPAPKLNVVGLTTANWSLVDTILSIKRVPPPELIEDDMTNWMEDPLVVSMPTEPAPLITDPIDDFEEVAILCTEDAYECPNGSWVSRNPYDECNFYPCDDDPQVGSEYEDTDSPPDDYTSSNFVSAYSTICEWHISSGYAHNTCSNIGNYPSEWDLIPNEFRHNYFFGSAEECCDKSLFGMAGEDCVVLDYCNDGEEVLLEDGTESTVHPNSIPQADGEYIIIMVSLCFVRFVLI